MRTFACNRFHLFHHEQVPWHGIHGWIRSCLCLSFISSISTRNVDGCDPPLTLAWFMVSIVFFLSTCPFFPVNLSGSKGKSCPIVVGSLDRSPSPPETLRGAGTGGSRRGTDTPSSSVSNEGVSGASRQMHPGPGWVGAGDIDRSSTRHVGTDRDGCDGSGT